MDNPFSVNPPDSLGADQIVDLFVDVLSDFQKILDQSHTFINGARGTGKSMMLRYLEPDCQIKASEATHLKDLKFFGVLIPIKKTQINITDLDRSFRSKHAAEYINEHLLILYIVEKITESFLKSESNFQQIERDIDTLKDFKSWLSFSLNNAGYTESLEELENASEFIPLIKELLKCQKKISAYTGSYIRNIGFQINPQEYKGALLGFYDFLWPLIKHLKAFSFMPDGPFFIMFDDADNLSEIQTRILNLWVHSRTTQDICLKISTQLNYKTYYTTNNYWIESPHDFSVINITDIYTASKGKYKERVSQIAKRRLEAVGINISPTDFFPVDQKQEEAIDLIQKEIAESYKAGNKKGYKLSDDVTRYARPEYIRRLRGISKNGATYKYAGFDQIVHISSGIIREFLDSAHMMYAEMLSRDDQKNIDFIEPIVQHDILKRKSEDFYQERFNVLFKESDENNLEIRSVHNLKNLIDALGLLFESRLIDETKSERRVFSVAISDHNPDEEVIKVFDMGVRYGFFHKSTIKRKEGIGRTYLFILNRILAPRFSLDPTSFAGYVFKTTADLKIAFSDPKALVRQDTTKVNKDQLSMDLDTNEQF